uniref:Uncharacterized protein n=1 Tax=Candidatus Kentrum sp. TUN TaxID=2126343 RepID=A0A450Z9Q1_9GAMM|nr:MAG: hypothetical protein BECKTUN1418E_GA0071001_100361 [Candidatus Kentron sp. TUN]VFK51789.1 MAG: hypothetical protein BECKTUN1418F_GA0071002_100361 [Candidatus Kentron sp. TUN]VFK58315.1 MAG: hypothetical protein BECKTUN1418D_GA0071000_10802 [Candidatus Kentron sp. TUN]
MNSEQNTNTEPNTKITITALSIWLGLITLFATMVTLAITFRTTNPPLSLVFLALSVPVGGYGILRAIKGGSRSVIIISGVATMVIVALLFPRQWDSDLTTAIRVIAALGIVAVLLWRWFSSHSHH